MVSKRLKGFVAAAFLGATAFSNGAAAQQAPAAPLPGVITLTPEDLQALLQPQKPPTPEEIRKEIRDNPDAQALYMYQIRQFIGANHVDSVKSQDSEKMMGAAINGMLQELDPHSSYMNPEEFKKFMESAAAEYAGIGLRVGPDDQGAKVNGTTKNSPAARANLQSGDIVTHVNGKAIAGQTLEEIVSQIKGDPQTPVKLKVLRNGVALPEITLVREFVKSEPVQARMIGNDIAYIQIETFAHEKVDEEVRNAVNNLKKNNRIAGYILDVRFNGGGYLHMVNNIVDDLLDNTGVIVTTRGRNPAQFEEVRAKRGEIAGGRPVIVLTNELSASASEILAAALQDHKRATILGTQTFGKGSVQTVVPLAFGDAIKLTTAQYYAPSGRSIQGLGVTPDILYVAPKGEELTDIPTESGQKNTLANTGSKTVPPVETKSTCAPVPTVTPVQPNVDKALQLPNGLPDYQLICAVENLRKQNVLTTTQPYVKPAAKAAPQP